MELYKQDFGKQKAYPIANGGGFLTRLYQLRILPEAEVYICPATADEISEVNLQNLLHEDILNSNHEGATSYAGRKNAKPKEYPGLYKLFVDNTLTTIAADDWQGPEDAGHHQIGTIVNFLFIDGHVEEIKLANFIEDQDDHGYSQFAAPDEPANGVAEPLTN